MKILFTYFMFALTHFVLAQENFKHIILIDSDPIVYSNIYLEKDGFRVLNQVRGSEIVLKFDGQLIQSCHRINKKITLAQTFFAYINRRSKYNLRLFSPIARLETDKHIIYLSHTAGRTLYYFNKKGKFVKVRQLNKYYIDRLIEGFTLSHQVGGQYEISSMQDKKTFQIQANFQDNLKYKVGVSPLFSQDQDNFYFSTDFDNQIQAIGKFNGLIQVLGQKGLHFTQELAQNKPIDIYLLSNLSHYNELFADTNNLHIYRTYSIGNTTEFDDENMETVLSHKAHFMQIYDDKLNFIKEVSLGNQGLHLLGSEKDYLWFYAIDFIRNQYLLYKIPLSTWDM